MSIPEDTFREAHMAETCECREYVERCICETVPYQGESHDLKCCVQEQKRVAQLRQEQREDDARHSAKATNRDILAELNDWALYGSNEYPQEPIPKNLATRAMNEIERLRAKINALREVSSGDDVNLDKLLDDVRSIIRE